MPSNKTFVIVIFCGAIVVSAWLFSRSTPITLPSIDKSLFAVNDPRPTIATNDDWKNILSNTVSANDTITDLTKSNIDDTNDDTTLTAAMSRDIMSQYLLLKQGGQSVSTGDMQTIINNVLSSPNYQPSGGAVYIASNLKIIKGSDQATLKQYKNNLNKAVKTRLAQFHDDPIAILEDALNNNNPEELTKIGPTLAVVKEGLDDLLNMSVPENAVKLHLALLNSVSDILANLQVMGQGYSDPVGVLVGATSYNNNLQSFATALQNMNDYLNKQVPD